MRRNQKWIPISLFLVALSASGCGPIPTDPDINSSLTDRVYVNDDWGFQITIPQDSTWSWDAQANFQARHPNGLPWVRVSIYKRSLDGGQFRPTLTLEPQALSGDDTLENVVTALEDEFKASSALRGYNASDKQAVQVSSGEAMEWTFRTSSRGSVGNRFLVMVVVHNRQWYLMLGSGVSSHFPVDEFRGIISSLAFLE